MEPRTLENAFACFRREHDLEALAEVFDRTASELLEVARHLISGRGEAEDLVQATFLAAIEGAARFEEGRELVPWLVGILANLARRARERRSAVGAPDAELADPRAPDPAARAAESEFRAALEHALAHVPARYREVLASHLGEGRAPEEIARELGRAPGTVRVQLHRGFRTLRRLLPAGFALGAAGWLAPHGLAAVRAEVLRAARGGSSAPSPALTLGGMLVAKKLALVGIVLLLAVSTWLFLTRDDQPAVQGTLAASTTLAAPQSSARPAGLEPVEPVGRFPAGFLEEDSVASSEPYGSLAVALTWWDGTPAEGLDLRFHPFGERQPSQAVPLARTDAQGMARVERVHEGTVGIELWRLTRLDWFQVDVERGTITEERISFPRGMDVVGRVLDAHGRGVGGAQLWVKEDLMNSARIAGRSEQDGSFRVRSVVEGFGLQATADGLGSSEVAAWEELETIEPEIRRVELRLRGESAELTGTVTDPDGDPVAGAVVSIRCFNTKVERTLRYWPFVWIATDEHGAFRIGGLHAGGADVRITAPGFALRKTSVLLEEGRTSRAVIVLDRGFTVRGSVALGDGSPVPGASLRVSQGGIDEDDLQSLYTTADDAGEYVLAQIPEGTSVLVAFHNEEHLQAQTRLVGRTGDELTWNVVFGSGPSIRGRAVNEAGRALAAWRVEAMPAGQGATMSGEVSTDEHGAFVLPDLTEAPFHVLLRAPRDRNETMVRAKAGPLLPGGPDVELVVRGEPSAFVLGRVLDPDGKPIRAKQMWARRKDELNSVAPTWSEDDRFRIGPMLAGDYELAITIELGTPSFNRDVSLAEGEELDLGDLVFPRWGDARLTLRGPDGGPIVQPAALCLTEGRFAHVLTSADGLVFESGPLWPGTYSLRAMSGSAAPDPPIPVVIHPGETTRAEMRLSAGRTVLFDFHVPAGERLPRRLSLELRDEADVVQFDQDGCRPQSVGGSEVLMAIGALPFGPFTYSAHSEDGWSAFGTLALEAGPELQLRVPIQLVRAR